MSGKNSLQELYDQLKQFHLSDSLYVIGAVNAALKYGTQKLDRKNIPDWIWPWLQTRGRDEQDRRSLSIILSRMARLLLLSSANDYKGVSLDLNLPSVKKAFDQVVNIEELNDDELASNDTIDKFALYFNRIGQIQLPLQANKKKIVGRGYLLFCKLTLANQTEYDFNEKFKENFGLTMFQFMSTGFVLWILSNGTLDYEMKDEIQELKHVITKDSHRIFLSLSCGTPQRYRELVRGNDWKHVHKLKDLYAFEPFAIMPAVKIEKSSHLPSTTYLIPQAKYLLDRASSGIFYLLADAERVNASNEGKHGKNLFRKAFGMVYRAYVGKHLSINGQHVFIDLDNDFVQMDSKLPDFAIIQDDVCLLFEVKTSLLKIEARTYFEMQTLENEVRTGNIQKAIKQLKEFKQLVLSGRTNDPRFERTKAVINIVVGYEDIWCLNSTLLPILDKENGIDATDLQFACISDIEAIGSAIEQKLNITEILQNKIANVGERQWAIATLLRKMEYKNSVLDQAFEEFLVEMGVPGFQSEKS